MSKYIICMDDDLQTHPNQIEKLINEKNSEESSKNISENESPFALNEGDQLRKNKSIF